ncbi:MAG: gamma-glutamyl-gamma-aminobutyrate hydrolase family protein, partial [Desulfitobacteriaceae bacterium]|nr:gamma-glutamyl-gamma-aminobutyrate hydrolase family protein [Desulfitobacteriaceae bacterium]
MSHPLIGITCSEDYSNDSFMVRNYYFKATEACGGVPIILPSLIEKFSLENIYSLLDGIILSGGADVDPILFGEEPIKGVGKITPLRDQFEINLAGKFFEMKKPILAICRGIQVLNIALGGTIYQDINSQVPNCLKHDQEAPKWHVTHRVAVDGHSKLSQIIGALSYRVNSFHHQAVRQSAPGFIVSARAEDGVVEWIEAPEHPFAIGVQWHPECNWHLDQASRRLFQSL